MTQRIRVLVTVGIITLLATVFAFAQSDTTESPVVDFFASCEESIEAITEEDSDFIPVIELTTFRLLDEADESVFMEAATGVEEALQTVDGFLCRQLLVNDNGDWVDVLYWATIEEAEAAFDVMEPMIFGDENLMPFFMMMDPESIDLRYFNPR